LRGKGPLVTVRSASDDAADTPPQIEREKLSLPSGEINQPHVINFDTPDDKFLIASVLND
jgi:hypothetical protein